MTDNQPRRNAGRGNMNMSTLNLKLGTWNSRRLRPRRGVVLLIVVSLLALFILLGVTYSLSVTQYLNASKLEIAVERTGDRPETETDIILGQILFDTPYVTGAASPDKRARTSLSHHSL